jgi:hypothetical protein
VGSIGSFASVGSIGSFASRGQFGAVLNRPMLLPALEKLAAWVTARRVTRR